MPVLEIVAPPRVRPDEPVPVVIRITNPSAQPLELHVQGREIAFDIVVTQGDGTIVWRRLAGAVVQGILQLKTLAPGETLELKDVWRQRTDAGAAVPAGAYTLQGVVPTDEREPLRTPVAPLLIERR